MAKEIQIQELGFDTWLDLYKQIEQEGNHNLEKVVLEWPPEVNEPVVIIKLCTIKANAFDEIYQSLPVEGTAESVIDLLTGELTGAEQNQIVRMIKRLPTKQELEKV